MKTKNALGFILASLFLVVLFANLSTAVVLTSTPSTLDQDSSLFTFKIKGSSDALENVSFSAGNIVEGSNSISFLFSPSSLILDNSSEQTITVTYSTTNFDFKLGKSYSSTVNLDSNTTDASFNVNFEKTQYCTYPQNSNLDLEISSIDVLSGFGDDDEYWYPMDEVEIEVEFEYNGDNRDDEFNDGEIFWELLTSDGKSIFDDDFSISDLEDGDDGSSTFTITLDADDLDDNEEDYTLYVRLVGDEDLDNGTSRTICASDSFSIQVNIDRNFVIVSNINVPETLAPGETFLLRGEIVNIGSKDQEDITLKIYNKLLDINEEIEFNEIDSFDTEDFSIELKIPLTAKENSYGLNFKVYDEDNDVFENDEDDESSFDYFIKVEGESQSTIDSKVLINAYLQGEAIEGNQAKVKASITNLGTASQTYVVKIEDYSSWATLSSGASQIVILNSGESKELELIFNLNKDSSGDKNFNIDIYSTEDDLIETQPVQISIQEKAGFSGLFENWHIWLIAGLNIILVLIIILVVIKILRR